MTLTKPVVEFSQRAINYVQTRLATAIVATRLPHGFVVIDPANMADSTYFVSDVTVDGYRYGIIERDAKFFGRLIAEKLQSFFTSAEDEDGNQYDFTVTSFGDGPDHRNIQFEIEWEKK